LQLIFLKFKWLGKITICGGRIACIFTATDQHKLKKDMTEVGIFFMQSTNVIAVKPDTKYVGILIYLF